jgi:protein-S-isoprenylcysteine O-methyltransferase Ste14
MKTVFIFLISLWLAVVIINLQKLNLFLVLFIIFAAVERFWETFLSARYNILDKNSKFDWLFKIIGLFYVILMFGTVLESIYFFKEPDYRFAILGFCIFFPALFLRLSAVRALGGVLDTNIFAGESPPGQKKLVRRGPYKYLRHPIYLGTILECLSIPLAYSCRYTFLFALLFCLPLLVARAYLEERESEKIFGQDYLKYKSEVKAFLPLPFRKTFKQPN